MAEPTLLDRTFSIVMKGFVETGQAPHYTEIAARLGVSPREGRHALRKLFAVRAIPGWLYPKVDFMAVAAHALFDFAALLLISRMTLSPASEPGLS